MKWTFLSISLFFYIFTTFAQVPQSFNYQAVARDGNGNILDLKQISLKISILKGSVSGSSVYTETHTLSTNHFGLINLEIGRGITSDSFDQIDWSTGQYFLNIEMDENGGGIFKQMGTTQLLSVPFALYAANTPNSFNLHYPDGFSNISNVTQEIDTNKSYTVPAGKNFYIQAAQCGLKIDSYTFDLAYHPLMIVGPEQTISGIESCGVISGFLVEAKVTASTIDLANGDYIVPEGKIFVLYAASNSINLLIDGANINPNGISSWDYPPLILTPGRTLSGNTIINGYLK
jgi:hypothetical protein